MRGTTLNQPLTIPGRQRDYFNPPHGGRPPSDEAVRTATQRYVEEAKKKAPKRAKTEREKS